MRPSRAGATPWPLSAAGHSVRQGMEACWTVVKSASPTPPRRPHPPRSGLDTVAPVSYLRAVRARGREPQACADRVQNVPANQHGFAEIATCRASIVTAVESTAKCRRAAPSARRRVHQVVRSAARWSRFLPPAARSPRPARSCTVRRRVMARTAQRPLADECCRACPAASGPAVCRDRAVGGDVRRGLPPAAGRALQDPSRPAAHWRRSSAPDSDREAEVGALKCWLVNRQTRPRGSPGPSTSALAGAREGRHGRRRSD
jgi:hypothetical protein